MPEPGPTTTGAHVGRVRSWDQEAGWGVIDSPATPGGCWTHFSTVLVAGYRALQPGASVHLEWERAEQDGCAFRAVHVWPVGQTPTAHDARPDHAAFSSTLVITAEAPHRGSATTSDAGEVRISAADVSGAGARVPPGAVTPRVGHLHDLAEVHRLWTATFPHLPAPDVTSALTEGRTLVLSDVLTPVEGAPGSDRLTGAALVSAVTDAPQERRLTLLADRSDRWVAVEACAARLLREQGVACWHVVVREDATSSVEQLQAAGYELSARSWGAALAAQDADVAALSAVVDDVAADGVSVRRLGVDDAEAAQRLVVACRADFPSTPATPVPDPTVEGMRQALASAEHAAFGAFSDGGDRLVGLTTIDLGSGGRVADTDLTAVAADHRGRGVASAVKARAVLDLLEHGVRSFRTGGAAVNEASIRANRRLGYDLEPMWTTWTRR